MLQRERKGFPKGAKKGFRGPREAASTSSTRWSINLHQCVYVCTDCACGLPLASKPKFTDLSVNLSHFFYATLCHSLEESVHSSSISRHFMPFHAT